MSVKQSRREWLKLTAVSAAAISLSVSNRTVFALPKTGKPIKLSSNENPYGFSPKARQAILDALADGNRYADAAQVAKLEKAIADREGVKSENVVLGSGSGEVLCMAGIAYGWQNGEIVSPNPTFAMLARYAGNFGAKINNVALNAKLEHDLDAMAKQVTAKTSLVYVCNPNNPTATITPQAALKQFCSDTAKKTAVFADEAYLEYTDDFPRNSLLDLVRNGENVIVCRTFSKIYGMAGLRMGYGIAGAETAQRLKKFRMTWFNALAVNAALASLSDDEFVPVNRKRNAEVRTAFCKELDAMKLRYAESHANFVWVDAAGLDKEIVQKLAARNIMIGSRNPLVGFDGLRVTVGTAEEMRAFTKALGEIKG